MRIFALVATAALGLSACGAIGESEAVVTVRVVDFDGSTLGAVPVTAELRTIAEVGVPSQTLDVINTSTDGAGIAYITVKETKDYWVNAELEVPSDPGCSYVASTWVSSANPEVELKLTQKRCA